MKKKQRKKHKESKFHLYRELEEENILEYRDTVVAPPENYQGVTKKKNPKTSDLRQF